MSLKLLRKGRVEIGFLPYTIMFGLSYDKPDVFITIGFIYLEISLVNKKKKRHLLHNQPPKHPRGNYY